MTDKRFIITNDGITDTQTEKQYNKISSKEHIYESVSFSDLLNICKLLNKLNDENEQLRREKGKQEEEIEILSETLATKRNSNEVYQKRIIELEKQITDLETSYELLKEQRQK